MQFVLQGPLLFRASRDSARVAIDVLDVETGKSFSRHGEVDPAGAEVVSALLDGDSDRVRAVPSEPGLTLTYTRVLPSGLELRPQSIELRPAEAPLSRLEMISELCQENARLQAAATLATKSADLRAQCLETMVEEKEQYQESLLKRVSAILDDRNARMATAKIKDEPER